MVAVAKELEAENYHDIKRITARKDNVIRLWEYLLELLRARRQRLEMNLGLQKIFQEMLYIMDWMDEMKVNSRTVCQLYSENKQAFIIHLLGNCSYFPMRQRYAQRICRVFGYNCSHYGLLLL